MSRISVNICAYILALYPSNHSAAQGRQPASTQEQRLESLAQGLALPSFWSREEILRTFVEASRIWIREADIEFKPINISSRSHTVPADGTRMWRTFLGQLTPSGRGVGVGFVYDLPGDDRSNLMYRSRNPRVANAGMLNDEQKRKARERAATV